MRPRGVLQVRLTSLCGPSPRKFATARPTIGPVRWFSSARPRRAIYVVAGDGPPGFTKPSCLGIAIEGPVLKHAPCAYCGTIDLPRTRGHVFPRAIYPDSLPNAKRITVPECDQCKTLWEDAEPHFRNILLTIWNPEAAPTDSRSQKFLRSFDHKDGHRRAKELASLFTPAVVAGQDRSKIYPAKDERFNLVLRRIVRGLTHHHGLATAVPDQCVDCEVMQYLIPPAFEDDFSWHTIAPDFIVYGYTSLADENIQLVRLVRFSKHIVFIGRVRNASSDA